MWCSGDPYIPSYVYHGFEQLGSKRSLAGHVTPEATAMYIAAVQQA